MGTRPRRRQILVYTGGLRTEPAYLTGLIRHCGRRGVAVTVKSKGLDRRQLVHDAAAFVKRSRELFDDVWCVVDVDEFDFAATIGAATKRAQDLGGDHTRNPSTGMWRLVEMIREQT